jgi:hypothetical protein
MAIKFVAHLADIHIPKAHKRHREYQEVFNRTCNMLSEQKPDRINIVGDLFHDKLNISNEANILAASFLSCLSSIAPVRITMGNHDCYSEGHQVLTKDGWVTFEDYIESGQLIEVMTYNQETDSFEFQYPINTIKKKYSGVMLNFKSSKLDMTVTPTHEVLYSDNHDVVNKKKAIDILIKSHKILLTKTSTFECVDKWYELLGFTLADGTIVIKNKATLTCCVQFHLKKQRKIEYLLNLLDSLSIPYTYRDSDKKTSSKMICIYSTPAENICKELNYKKELSWDIISIDHIKGKSFIDGYLQGDGCNTKGNHFKCSTIFNLNKDILTTLARLVGYTSTNLPNRFGGFENSKEQSVFSINTGGVTKTAIKNVNQIDYNGFVYCLTVPNSNLLIKNKETIFIGGNCNVLRKDRVDSIQALVDLIQNPDVIYYNKSGFYVDENVVWVVWHHNDHFSPWNELNNPTPENEKYFYHDDIVNLFDKHGSMEEIRKSYKFIDLFHDPVNGCKMFNGMELSKDSYLNMKDFQGDLVMMGDIHLQQAFSKDGKKVSLNSSLS